LIVPTCSTCGLSISTIGKLQKFLLELGRSFAFMDRQHRFDIGKYYEEALKATIGEIDVRSPRRHAGNHPLKYPLG
jgi:hypothetical protein